MATDEYIREKEKSYISKTTNVFSLIHEAHANQRKERAKTIYIACIAALVLILIGIVVSV